MVHTYVIAVFKEDSSNTLLEQNLRRKKKRFI